jgi:pilus assembly protein CpaC
MNSIKSIARKKVARVLTLALLSTSMITSTAPLDARARPAAKAAPKQAAKPSAFASTIPVQVRSDPMGVARAQRPANDMTLSIGRGQLINLPAAISDVFISNEAVADVQVRSATAIYVLAKGPGESTIYATSKSGTVVYSTTVHAGQNVSSIDQMLRLAMPEASIVATPMNGIVLLTGTVSAPEDVEEATNLVQAYVGEGTKVVTRVRTATPLQVNLQVKIAEVSRSLVKEIGANLLSRDTGGGFNIASGRNFGSIGTADISQLPRLDASQVFGLPTGSISLPFDPKIGQFVTSAGTAFDYSKLALGAGQTSIGIAGRLFGIDIASAIDLAEKEGLVTTLAQPNLTALSGETASFLAGGEFPVPISQTQGALTIEYKQYGVSLAFTPTVLADGRISMRVRPEVSELSAQGTVRLNGFDIPALTTRRTETTVELGSGQSFMIGGLLSNSHTNSIDRAPGLGNVPVLGAMFRSTSFRRNETELVIMITPYLVKPVNANQIALPTDGYKTASDLERVLLGKTYSRTTGEVRPGPSMAPPSTVVAPTIGGADIQRNLPQMSYPNPTAPPRGGKPKKSSGAAVPGFSVN